MGNGRGQSFHGAGIFVHLSHGAGITDAVICGVSGSVQLSHGAGMADAVICGVSGSVQLSHGAGIADAVICGVYGSVQLSHGAGVGGIFKALVISFLTVSTNDPITFKPSVD